MERIPKDVVEQIISFSCGRCDCCKKSFHFKYLSSNYSVAEYNENIRNKKGVRKFIIYEKICPDCKWIVGLSVRPCCII